MFGIYLHLITPWIHVNQAMHRFTGQNSTSSDLAFTVILFVWRWILRQLFLVHRFAQIMVMPTSHTNVERGPVCEKLVECVELREKYLYKPRFASTYWTSGKVKNIPKKTNLVIGIRAPYQCRRRICPLTTFCFACSVPDHKNIELITFTEMVEKSPFSFIEAPRKLPKNVRYAWNKTTGIGEVLECFCEKRN